MEIRDCGVWRFAGGKVAEISTIPDQSALLKQIGYFPEEVSTAQAVLAGRGRRNVAGGSHPCGEGVVSPEPARRVRRANLSVAAGAAAPVSLSTVPIWDDTGGILRVGSAKREADARAPWLSR